MFLLPLLGYAALRDAGSTTQRTLNRYDELNKTAARVWTGLRTVQTATAPFVKHRIKDLLPPATAMFNAVKKELLDKKIESPNIAPAPAAKAAGSVLHQVVALRVSWLERKPPPNRYSCRAMK